MQTTLEVIYIGMKQSTQATYEIVMPEVSLDEVVVIGYSWLEEVKYKSFCYSRGS